MILFLSSDYPGLVSISSRRSVLGVAILAVDGLSFCGFEWNFAFLLAVRAHSFVHLSGASVETPPLSITQFFHSFLSVMPKNIQRILWHPCTDSNSPALKWVQGKGLRPWRRFEFQPTHRSGKRQQCHALGSALGLVACRSTVIRREAIDRGCGGRESKFRTSSLSWI